MKILVDARQATRNLTGIRTCITSLVRELVGQNHETGKILILPDQALTPFRKTEHRSPADILWGLVKHEIWKQLYLPIKAARERADVLVSLDPIGPLFCTKPTVITIHDLTCFNEGVKWDRWSIYERILVPLCARRASKIITFAQATRRDINEYLGIGDDKIVVTAEGADEHFRVTTDTDGLDDVRLRYDLPESFILTVGSLRPKRNLERLVTAFSMLKKDSSRPEKLVLTGESNTKYGNKVRRLIDELDLNDEVQLIGFVPQEDLVFLYNLASLYVYPSLSEGFGLTVLEAMSCGCPVITSGVSSLPEVVGEAGRLIDPMDVDDLAGAMKAVIGDDALLSKMREMGLERAGIFSWEKVARDIVEACESIPGPGRA